MDIHGGKGIILGPKELPRPGLGRRADLDHGRRSQYPDPLTDDFGQGAIRCHPYVLKELEALKIKDDAQAPG